MSTPNENTNAKPCWKEYKLHIAVLVIVLLAELVIRKQTVTFSNDVYGTLSIGFQPFVFAMLLGLIAFWQSLSRQLANTNPRQLPALCSSLLGLFSPSWL